MAAVDELTGGVGADYGVGFLWGPVSSRERTYGS